MRIKLFITLMDTKFLGMVLFNGKPLAPGKYQYHIELVNGKRVEYTGEVILLR